MKTNSKVFPFALAFAAQASARAFLRLSLLRANAATVPWSNLAVPAEPRCAGEAAARAKKIEPRSIYIVDDLPRLTELYTRLLEPIGFPTRTFNDRTEALNALKTDRKPPLLLITDYLGPSLPVDQFLQSCRLVHPSLRILMASGLAQSQMRFSEAKPDRFLQKPFTAAELQREVRAALTLN